MDRKILAKELAKIIGVNKTTIFNWERGVYMPMKPSYFRKIKEITGLNFEYKPKDRKEKQQKKKKLTDKNN